MRIHKLGNDYVQANKFEKESVKHVENQTADNRPEPSEEIPAKTAEAEETAATAKKEESRRGGKAKKSD